MPGPNTPSKVDETLDGIVTTHLGSMAARCTSDLRVSRAVIDAVVRQVRTEMAATANKLADERGEPPLDAWRDGQL
jgi:hypothetical protein